MADVLVMSWLPEAVRNILFKPIAMALAVYAYPCECRNTCGAGASSYQHVGDEDGEVFESDVTMPCKLFIESNFPCMHYTCSNQYNFPCYNCDVARLIATEAPRVASNKTLETMKGVTLFSSDRDRRRLQMIRAVSAPDHMVIVVLGEAKSRTLRFVYTPPGGNSSQGILLTMVYDFANRYLAYLQKTDFPQYRAMWNAVRAAVPGANPFQVVQVDQLSMMPIARMSNAMLLAPLTDTPYIVEHFRHTLVMWCMEYANNAQQPRLSTVRRTIVPARPGYDDVLGKSQYDYMAGYINKWLLPVLREVVQNRDRSQNLDDYPLVRTAVVRGNARIVVERYVPNWMYRNGTVVAISHVNDPPYNAGGVRMTPREFATANPSYSESVYGHVYLTNIPRRMNGNAEFVDQSQNLCANEIEAYTMSMDRVLDAVSIVARLTKYNAPGVHMHDIVREITRYVRENYNAIING